MFLDASDIDIIKMDVGETANILCVNAIPTTSYNIRVVVFKVPLQELEEKCYTVTDAVDRYVYLPQDGFKEAPTTALYEFVN